METQKQNAVIDLRLSLIDAAQCFHWVETERGFGAVLEGNAKVLMSSPSDRAKLRQELGYRAENVAGLTEE